MAQLGQLLLLLALATSIYGLTAAILGGKRNSPQLVNSAGYARWALLSLLTLASAVLIYGFFSRDFSLKYVADNSSSDMSPFYRLSAFWAGNEGSLLFWTWFLSLLLIFLRAKQLKELTPYIWGVVSGVEAFLLTLMVFLTSPFEKLPFPPLEGQGLNPLLEDPGMFFHPPFLLSGYAGFTIPFAFTLAALINGKWDYLWLREIRTWTVTSWLLLSVGILLGMEWAYTVLGWGGYWGWDPVENASLMPWLTATASLHSITVHQRRGMLKMWNVMLVIITFHLIIFGTFITRSGILSSVHTFGASVLGPPFTAFLTLSLSISLYFLVKRRRELKSKEKLDHWLCRENYFLFNNLILVAIAFAILLGTFFPFIAEVLTGARKVVGPSYYEPMVGPLFLTLILLMGICPLLGWKKTSLQRLWGNFGYPLLSALSLAFILYLIGIRVWYALVAFPILGLVVGTIFLKLVRGIKARRLSPRYGGYIVHLGIVLLAVGIIGSHAFDVATQSKLSPGQEMTINNYTLKYQSLSVVENNPKRQVFRAILSVYDEDKSIGELAPERKFYRNMSVNKVAIKSTWKEDLYVILTGWNEKGEAIFKVQVNPLVNWIWMGGIVLVLGAIIALYPERLQR